MARARTEPKEETVEEIEARLEEDDVQDVVPVDQMDPAWQALYNRAVKRGCTEKAARLYADAHHRDKEPADGEDT